MITKAVFGACAQGTVDAYTLTNSSGMAVTVLTLGGILQKILVPTAQGPVDVCLGYDTLEEYLAGHAYFGAVIGRYANRIGGAGFLMPDGYRVVTANHGPHQLHGGPDAFDRKLWTARTQDNSLQLTYHSPDGENGFPGNLEVTVTYTLGDDNSLRIDYRAVPDKLTVVNMTNHAYFNLHGTGSVLEDVLWVDADRYTAIAPDGIPTGELPEVNGTCLDFRKGRAIGSNRDLAPGFYDHNLCLNGEGLRLAARLESKDLTMEMLTTEPGVQVYCSCVEKPIRGKGGSTYEGWSYLCLEAQNYPDAVHHPHFPSSLVGPGECYSQTTIYKFT